MVAYFPGIPERLRADVESIVTRAIKRAIAQCLCELEREAEKEIVGNEGRGKQAKGYNPHAIHWHKWWAIKLRKTRVGGSAARATPSSEEIEKFYELRSTKK